MNEQKHVTAAQSIRSQTTVEIELPLPEKPKMLFRRVSLSDFACVGLLPVEIFKEQFRRQRMTEKQLEQLYERHITGMFSHDKAAENFYRMIDGILVACSINPKIVANGTVQDRDNEITLDELGQLKEFVFNRLCVSSGMDVGALAPFRDGAASPNPRPNRKTVRHKTKHPAV